MVRLVPESRTALVHLRDFIELLDVAVQFARKYQRKSSLDLEQNFLLQILIIMHNIFSSEFLLIIFIFSDEFLLIIFIKVSLIVLLVERQRRRSVIE